MRAIKVVGRCTREWSPFSTCDLCLVNCPANAIVLLDGRPEVDEGRCTGCGVCMRVCPTEALVASQPYTDIVDKVRIDEDGTAAIKCGAQHIVTDNLADFPIEVLEQYDIEAIDADEFLSRTFDLYPSEALAVLRELRAHYRNPPYTAPEFILDLTAKGLPKLAARARQHQAFI